MTLTAAYKADAIANVDGGVATGQHVLDNLELIAEADLEALASWRGARAMLHVLRNHGEAPNALAGTLQGIDNIEVADGRTKLYQAWIEQEFAGGKAALLFGLADLNADFYQTDASGLLIAPAFGIGSELAATGPNGPSIFPSTALTARLRFTPSDAFYAHAAVVNAKAGVLGDRDGVDFEMRDGALLIAEAGLNGPGVAIGAWRYTKRQPDIRNLDSAGNPLGRVAQGAYLLWEHALLEGGGRRLDGFARLGVSDARTSPFKGGWQAGVLLSGVLGGRPNSQLSFGVNQAYVSDRFKALARDAGQSLSDSETGFELTFADKLSPHVTVQPDLQYIRRPAADPALDDAVVAGLRLTFEFSND